MPGGDPRNERVHREIEKEPADPRTPGQRDRDRLLYTPEFRRLAGVTQVVGSHELTLFHNRLTHTLKVAQFARRLAERHPADDVDADVVEAAALAHDIGHPPFGHVAEVVLDDLVVAEGSSDGFEGNAHSFRIVTALATRDDDFRGLNFTRATLQALTKYPNQRAVAPGVKEHRKYGTFAADVSDFTWSRHHLSAPGRQTAEAMLMDWADDVAYALHDLEDFVNAGFIPVERLAAVPGEQEHFLSRTWQRWADLGKELDDATRRAYEDTADTLFAEFPIGRDASRTMRKLVSSKANLYATGLSRNGVAFDEDPGLRRELDLLKSLTWTYVIESPALAAQQEGQRRIVKGLFEYFLDAAQNMPHVLSERVQQFRVDSIDWRVRTAADAVAGLGESQAVAYFARVSGLGVGSIYESLGP